MRGRRGSLRRAGLKSLCGPFIGNETEGETRGTAPTKRMRMNDTNIDANTLSHAGLPSALTTKIAARSVT